MVRASLAVLLVLSTALLAPGAAASPEEVRDLVHDLVHDCVFSAIPEDCLVQRLHDARQEAEALLRCLTTTEPCL